MTGFDRIKLLALALAILAGGTTESPAQGRPPMRAHTATEAQPLKLVAARKTVRGAQVDIKDQGSKVRMTANGVPGHKVGAFPNRGNPHRISAQRHVFQVKPSQLGTARPVGMRTYVGVGLNGVPFDPGAAEFWRGNPRSGWQYEALGGAVRLGLDANYAHVQPDGSYHYHGLPTGLMADLGWSRSQPSPLIGYAADGFPIYAITASVGGRTKVMQSSWRLKRGARPGGAAPGGTYDGAFVQDYEYRAGSGDLDECNGAYVKTAEFPQGTYAYFLTESFPVVPRCLKGRVDASFSKRR